MKIMKLEIIFSWSWKLTLKKSVSDNGGQCSENHEDKVTLTLIKYAVRWRTLQRFERELWWFKRQPPTFLTPGASSVEDKFSTSGGGGGGGDTHAHAQFTAGSALLGESNAAADLTGGGAQATMPVMGAAVNTFEVSLALPPLISCWAVSLLTGHRLAWGLGNPGLKDEFFFLSHQYCWLSFFLV